MQINRHPIHFAAVVEAEPLPGLIFINEG